MKICIITHQHLSRNPRVIKEAIALDKLNFEVSVLTSIYDVKLYQEDLALLRGSNIKLIYYNNLTRRNLSAYKNRLVNKIGRYLNKIGIENIFALGYAPTRCLALATAQNAQLYICHQELPTYIGTLLIKNKKNVAFDFEDFYSEDLLAKDRKYRPQKLLEKAESLAVNKATLLFTTSIPMAKALKNKYQSQKEFNIIFNSFNIFPNETTKTNTTIQLIWLSQTIGPGRGLEPVIKALNQVNNNNFTLNLRGAITEDYKHQLLELLTNSLHKLVFLPLLPNSAIQNDLCKYDIGLATELKNPLNKNLTISNKIFHYLSVGLPVIASNTAGQLTLGKNLKNGIKYFNNTKELRDTLNNLKADHIHQLKEEILAQYGKQFDWAIQETKLQHLILRLLKP